MSDVQMDWGREARTGVPETVLCGGKTSAQLATIVRMVRSEARRLLFTRLEAAAFTALDADVRSVLDYDPLSRTAILGEAVALVPGYVGIVAAGTSDMPVAREAQRTLAFVGYDAPIIADVGVAGLWRLLDRVGELRTFDVVIAVAGMEGALFSVLAGLIAAPVVAVPVSVGYGVAAGGFVALNSALASCASGVVTVNIDNGFGAAAAAAKMLKRGSSAK